MIPRSFEYYAPTTLDEAISLLQKFGDDGKILAGGQSLVPLMKFRLASPRYIVDITRIPGLSYIREGESGWLHIGAMTTEDEIENSPLVKSRILLLSEAASHIGDQQVRNRGTIGGSLCHADPAADLLPVMLVLEAEMKAKGPKGEKVVKAKDFFKDVFATAITQDEILTEIRIPPLPPQSGTGYIKFERAAGDFAIVAVGTTVTLGKDGRCEGARIGLASVADTPIRAAKAEDFLKGKALEEDAFVKAGEIASEGLNPPSDIRGSSEYRREMVKVFVKRTLRVAVQRAKEAK